MSKHYYENKSEHTISIIHGKDVQQLVHVEILFKKIPNFTVRTICPPTLSYKYSSVHD